MKLFFHKSVTRFITTLQKPTQAKWLRQVMLLEEYGNGLGMPHARFITFNLSELRVRGKQEVRAFFTVHKSTIIILHAFVKKTQKLPQREIDRAIKRLQHLTDI